MSRENRNRQEDKDSWSLDRNALAEVLPRYLPQLERFARRRFNRQLTRRESPADIVQSSCREVLRNLSSFDDFGAGEPAFRQWLFRTVERKLIDRERHHLRVRRSIAREEAIAHASRLSGRTSLSPSRLAAGGEDRLQLLAALQQLPANYCDVIRRIQLDGETAAAVGQREGKTRDAVHSLLARAMARLAQVLRAQMLGNASAVRVSGDDTRKP